MKKETLVSKLDIFLIFGQSKNGKFSAWNRKTEFSVSVSDFEPEMVLQSNLWLEKSTRRSAMKLIKVGDKSITPTFLRPSVIWNLSRNSRNVLQHVPSRQPRYPVDKAEDAKQFLCVRDSSTPRYDPWFRYE